MFALACLAAFVATLAAVPVFANRTAMTRTDLKSLAVFAGILTLVMALAGCASVDKPDPSTVEAKRAIDDMLPTIRSSDSHADKIIKLAEQEKAEKLRR